MKDSNPFSHFAPSLNQQTSLRRAITQATRRPETECLPPLIALARQSGDMRVQIAATSRQLIENLRAQPAGRGVQGLVQEYSLSSQEGVALMCLAEALLRIPDHATRDALIRDKISGGDWQSHIGAGRPLFVNAATWGLMVTGRLSGTSSDTSLGASLTRLIGKLGEPIIRAGVNMAMRLMGEQFVTGQTIEEALTNAAKREVIGYRFSFDMLGEAATTADDAERYFKSYEHAIHAIGRAGKNSPYDGNGISVKLSALHPRYSRAQVDRVRSELLSRVFSLAKLAKFYNIGFNIDAEEADRLELSLDLLEALSFEEGLSGWNGLGFVVQAYGRRCPYVIDYIVDLAKRSGRRMMVRLVKGAYWDSEIKRAQVEGLSDFLVFTRKIYTDVSYIACAKKLLDALEFVFPQFATHNAQTLATIYHMAGPNFKLGDYEFQCLHGMGEPLYDQIIGSSGLNRPCRIYAPVGDHETLLAYLVRRLLENGANSSFVNRIADHSISISELTADPAESAAAMPTIGAPHDNIAAPVSVLRARRNSQGLDLSNEDDLTTLGADLIASAVSTWHSKPLIAGNEMGGTVRRVCNPGNAEDIVGEVTEVDSGAVEDVVKAAAKAWPDWNQTPVARRAEILENAADAMQKEMHSLMGLLMREAGKTAANAVSEVREAIDFLRYYALEARGQLTEPQGLGVAICISPWNFPLAIFSGQVVAALVAGNVVIAKPAEETPLIAFAAVRILHSAGIPLGALQFLPGDGGVGAALVAASETSVVLFTGSTEVARLINSTLAKSSSTDDKPIPLIAETGGQNAMIVDSSALLEQVVNDVMISAFDSAGQRCSALRVLCLQNEIADRALAMIKGALRELCIGNTNVLATDIGPIISEDAKQNIEVYIAAMKKNGHKIVRPVLHKEKQSGYFVAPTIIEINSLKQLGREVFGPVLHVLRYDREKLDDLIDAINDMGYGLTFGLHTRIDETVENVTSRIAAGNIYVNRNTIGAVVGVQPFGGSGLSGTGPKAGGSLYLHRLVKNPTPHLLTAEVELNGPVGEKNLYSLRPRGRVLCFATTQEGLVAQKQIVAKTGNECVVAETGWVNKGPYAAALIEAKGDKLKEILLALSTLPGPIINAQVNPYCEVWLMEETTISINTTAMGGNANLMTIG